MRGVWFTLMCVVLSLAPRTAQAHGHRIASVELEEAAAGHAFARLTLNVPDPSLSLAIEACTVGELAHSPGALERAFSVVCPDRVGGRTLTVTGLGPILDEAVVRATLTGGAVVSTLLRPDAPSFMLPADAGAHASVLPRYFRLGVAHILSGPDHLLFLLLLVLALGRLRSVLLAESAFALSHTVSFAATTYGWVHLPSAPTEVAIALSLVLLAAEVSPARNLGPRRGATLAFVFGFVHGLGFAGGLREVGVDDRAAGFAVAGFGAGVEAAQVVFVLAATALFAHGARSARWPSASRWLLLASGTASAYWVIERGVAMFSAAAPM